MGDRLRTVDIAVLGSPGAVEPVIAEWDRLAVDAGLPYCAPGWLMAWWRHAAPRGALLRVVAARDGGRLVGIAPFYAVPWRAGVWVWSLLATEISSRVEPMGDYGVREALGRAVAAGSPPPARIDLDGVPADSPWPAVLGSGGSGDRPAWRLRRPAIPAPVVTLAGGTVDEWLGTRSSNFRAQMRRARRKVEANGGAFRVASSHEEIERDLVHFERLHNARWDWRGGSRALPPGALEMLADAGRAFGSERFQLVSLEIGGKVISSQLFLSAGTETSYWNGGFDDAFASYKPSLITLVEAIRISLEQGRTRFDLGPGAQDYKDRFTGEQDEVVWQSLIPHGRRYPLARALHAPTQVRCELGRRLAPEEKQKIKRLLRRSDPDAPRRRPT